MKEKIRKILLKQRNLLNSKEITNYEKQLFNFLNYFNIQVFHFLKNKENNRTINIGSYWPIKNEFNCFILMDFLSQQYENTKFFMPIVTDFDKKWMTFYEFNNNKDYILYKYGKIPNFLSNFEESEKYLNPKKRIKDDLFKKEDIINFLDEKKPEYLDLIIVPFVGFDIYLNRLGFGAGYYDIFFKNPIYKKAIKLGFGYEFQKNINLPVTQYDEKLDLIITEKGIYI